MRLLFVFFLLGFFLRVQEGGSCAQSLRKTPFSGLNLLGSVENPNAQVITRSKYI